jgi:hypothetical protein
MPNKRVNVSPHYRNGKPVRGYERRQTWSQNIGAIIAGHKKGSVPLALLGATGIGLGTATLVAIHTTMTLFEVATVLLSVACAILGVKSILGYRRKHPTRYMKKVTLSYRDRKHYLLARARMLAPMNFYRRRVQKARKKHPIITGAYDRWFGLQEVTITTGRGKAKTSRTFRVRGVPNADTFVAQETERFRQAWEGKKPPPFNISKRQVFR